MPTTRYARSGEVSVAFQTVGDGPPDLVYVPGWVSNVEVAWEDPAMADFLMRLASFSRLITFDKRGTGMSDAVPLDRLPTLEERMDDVRAVMDAAGSDTATLMGHSEGGNMCILFAASHPDRVERLILVSSYAKRIPTEDYPWAPDPEAREAEMAEIDQGWGDPHRLPDWIAPSRAEDRAFRTWMARYQRLSASPRAAANLLRMNTEIDTTAVLPSIQVPTLCLYRHDDRDVSIEEGRWIASRIPGAKLVELPGEDHWLAAGDPEPLLAAIEEFVTGHRPAGRSERVLATVLFTDIVGSTETASVIGDRTWRTLLERHNQAVRTQIERHRGRVVKATGDGFLAIFDGPARAIRAARASVAAVSDLGLEIRAGVHTGEVELIGDDVAGLGVHIGARIAALAGPGEVVVSRTVKDLVAGSGIGFEDRGTQSLKGVPETWQVYAVASG